MNLRKLLFLCLLLPVGNKIAADNKPVEETIIALERAAMDRWAKGDPDGFIELSTDDVVYVDPFLEQKLEGIDKLKELYKTVRGKVEIDRYEFIRVITSYSIHYTKLYEKRRKSLLKNRMRKSRMLLYHLEPGS